MKLLPFLNKDENTSSRKIAFQGGAYSLAVTAVVLAILVVVNILASVLPPAATKLDISAAKFYSITSNTKTVVNSLDKDITIYWIVQADQENKIIENLLSKYDSLSEHIKIIKKNPDAHPTFAAKYTDKE
jgi:ABC-2 type transport system permease protein